MTIRLSLWATVALCSLVGYGCELKIDTEGFVCSSDESCRIGTTSAAYICDKSGRIDGQGVCARAQAGAVTLARFKTIVRWTSGRDLEMGTGFCIGDVDNDGKTEVLSLGYNQDQDYGILRVYDEALAFEGQDAFTMPPRSCVVADLDKDGANELVIGTSLDVDHLGHLYVGSFKAGSWIEEWKSPNPLSILWGTELAVADLDHNGRNEIIAGLSSPTRRVELWEWDGSSGIAKTQTLNTDKSDVDSVAVGDVDGDGRLELVIGVTCWLGQGFQVWEVSSDSPERTSFQPGLGRNRVALGDVDGDSTSEILVGIGSRCAYVYDPYGVTVAKEEPLKKVVELYKHNGREYALTARSPEISQEEISIVAVDAGDLTGDKAVEVVGCAGSGTVICKAFSYRGGRFYEEWSWASKVSESIQQVRVVDIDNDARPEVLVATSKNLYAFRQMRPD